MLFNSLATAFATDHAPYIKYLSAIKCEEARTLERDLRIAASLIRRSKAAGRKEYRCTIAESLDIRVSADGKHDNASNRATLYDGGLTVPEPTAVASFLAGLDNCDPDVHTRVISLHSDRTTTEGTAADGLLFCHILGVILDLTPTDVRVLAQLEEPVDRIRARNRQPYQLPMKPGFVSLGESTTGRGRGVAAYIGRRVLGKSFPHIIVVRLPAAHQKPEALQWASAAGLCEPLVYSQWASHAASPTIHPWGFFNHALKHCLQSAPPLQSDNLTGSWLSALIYMDAIMRAGSLDELASRWPDTSEVIDINHLREISVLAKQICTDLQTSVNQVAAFHKSVPAVRQSDYHNASHFLERLMTEAKAMAEDIKDEFDAHQQIKNIEVASLAVNESRSAIALTVLAFIFIPINLASSLYGMNVQEINETGHSIWGFLITALVLLTCSGFGWVLWRACKHGRSKALKRCFAERVSLRRSRKTGPGLYDC